MSWLGLCRALIYTKKYNNKIIKLHILLYALTNIQLVLFNIKIYIVIHIN
jgi:hypothetical protein